MNKIVSIFRILSLILVFISTIIFSYSIIELSEMDCCKLNLTNIYSFVCYYSGLYKFTFIVCAFWVTLRQLEISQNNYTNTLNQMQFTQNDILLKRNREISSDTLKQCSFYLQEMQIAYKETMESKIINDSMPIVWSSLKLFTNENLKKDYPSEHEKFENIDRKTKNQVLIILYKFEAFSSLFIYGNFDKKLAQEIIGKTYTNQVCSLLGLISYFRKENIDRFGLNTIALYNEWKNNDKKD